MHACIKSTLRVNPSRKRDSRPRSTKICDSLPFKLLLELCDKFMVTCVRLEEEKEMWEWNHWIGTSKINRILMTGDAFFSACVHHNVVTLGKWMKCYWNICQKVFLYNSKAFGIVMRSDALEILTLQLLAEFRKEAFIQRVEIQDSNSSFPFNAYQHM